MVASHTMYGFAGVLVLASSTLGHIAVIPSTIPPASSSVMLALRMPHGAPNAGTTKVIITMPPGTYNTKPVPTYNFNLNITKRVLDPPVVVHGTSQNETVDQIIWTAVNGYEVPTWAVQDFLIQTSFLNVTGTTLFKFYQQHSDGTWRNWTAGNDTTGLPMTGGGAGGQDPHAGHNHGRRAAEGEDPAPSLKLAPVPATNNQSGDSMPMTGNSSDSSDWGKGDIMALVALILSALSAIGVVFLLFTASQNRKASTSPTGSDGTPEWPRSSPNKNGKSTSPEV